MLTGFVVGPRVIDGIIRVVRIKLHATATFKSLSAQSKAQLHSLCDDVRASHPDRCIYRTDLLRTLGSGTEHQ